MNHKGVQVPQNEHKAGDLDQTPAPFPNKPGGLQPIGKYCQSGNKEKVRQHMGIEAFRRRMSLEGPG
jgi:hypothetical protein